VTTPADVKETIEITKHAFFERGLAAAWPRVMAVVVQPGVEFSDSALFEYDRQQAGALSQFIRPYDHLVYEAHSTDYQTAAALKRMVEDQFAILKVGPALTFAFREAVFGLAMIEEELLAAKGEVELSRIRERLEEGKAAVCPKIQPQRPLALLLAREPGTDIAG
jgi:D-tagatose-1,6-bisphosphate aldolase subunit GatZ/KbaZ